MQHILPFFQRKKGNIFWKKGVFRLILPNMRRKKGMFFCKKVAFLQTKTVANSIKQ